MYLSKSCNSVFIKNSKKNYLFKFIFLGIFLFPVIIFASTTDGTILSTDKYAWGENVGWINLGTTEGNVHVTASALTGYMWDSIYGWVNLNPTNGGVLNDGQGNLSGYAWSAGAGYINFSGVVINSSGRFTGQAGTASTTYGRINFSCDNCSVITDWRPASAANIVGGSGSGSSYPFALVLNPITTAVITALDTITEALIPTKPTITPDASTIITTQKTPTTSISKTVTKPQVKIVPKPLSKENYINKILNSNIIQKLVDLIIKIYQNSIFLIIDIIGRILLRLGL